VSAFRVAQVSAHPRHASSRTKQESQTILVAGLTLLATAIAFYDLVLLAVGLR
jgi:hypothetical protein